MAESAGAGSDLIPKASAEPKIQITQEAGHLTPKGLERIYDLKQADQLLKSVGSQLPEQQKRELDANVSSRLAELVGWDLDPTSLNPSDRTRLSDFLNKWDTQTPEAQNTRISIALELLETEKKDPKSLRESFVNQVARTRETERHRNVKKLSDREIEEWDRLRKDEKITPENWARLIELQRRGTDELAKALGALGMKKGILPLLVNPETRRDYYRWV